MSTAPSDEFFVGYLRATPPGIARTLRRALVVCAVAFLLPAAWGLLQFAPGGRWDSRATERTGTLLVHPYPMLIATDGKDSRATLLVNPGKCGAGTPGYCGPLPPAAPDYSAFAALDGQSVSVRGTLLSRDGHSMIELESGIASVRPLSAPSARPVWSTESPITIRGRLVDPKCYMGAMRPADGQTHRACAARCIAGGIPPMLVAPGEPNPRYLVLSDTDGAPAAFRPGFLDLVGDTVEIRGRVRSIANAEFLAIDDIRRAD